MNELEVPESALHELGKCVEHEDEHATLCVRAIAAPVVAAVLREAAEGRWTTQQLLDVAESLDGRAS